MQETGSAKKEHIRYFIISGISLALAAIMLAAIYLFIIPPGYEQYYKEDNARCITENTAKYNLMMAIKNQDEQYCTKLSFEQAKICNAAIKKDATICEGGPENEKANCKAEILKNPSMCPKDDTRCLAYASGDETYCKKLDDTASVEECLVDIRMNAEFFVSEKAKQDCSDFAYAYAAIKSMDTTACQHIINQTLKERCYQIPR